MDIEVIYLQYVNDLYRYIYSLCRNKSTTEDLLQETFTKAHIVLLSKEVHEVKPWLFKVARYTYIDLIRKEKRTHLTNKIEGMTNESPEKIIVEQDSFQTLLSLMENLSLYEKETILLCDVNDCSYEEAASILDLKLNTMKSHLRRGRNKMRKLLAKEDENG